MSAVLSCGVTPLSGSFRLAKGPMDLVVRLGMAAAKSRVSHIQTSTLLDRVSLPSVLGLEEDILGKWSGCVSYT
jgi:hypothetical protein